MDSAVMNRAKKIKLILMDVDGVMTDGKLYYMPGPDGEVFETKGFNSHDGLGLHFCHHAGIETGVISGRVSPGTVERCKILNMKYVYQGFLDKIASYEEALATAGLAQEQVAFIGDDFSDVPLMHRAGLAVAVANSRSEVKEAAHYVTQVNGGEGAVREVIEIVLKSQGLWDAVITKYFASLTVR